MYSLDIGRSAFPTLSGWGLELHHDVASIRASFRRMSAGLSDRVDAPIRAKQSRVETSGQTMANQGRRDRLRCSVSRADIAARARRAATKGLPPVHLWNPPFWRRSRYADRQRRHVVLSRDADRPARAGEAVLHHPQARGRVSIFSSRRWRKSASASMTRRFWRLRCEKDERGLRPAAEFSHQCRRMGAMRWRSPGCVFEAAADGGLTPTCMCGRICGQKSPRALL